MNTEQTSENIFMYIKTHYVETILAEIGKLEKTMIAYTSYTNHLRFSLLCHHSKIHWNYPLIDSTWLDHNKIRG